ncbi:putative methyltransferase C9orf114 [Ricinus communis]|uniref:Protein C9orf114, putative n=1 Tax=Ricinus communis TaxID=3988 RepID=B9RTY3_RICCO|nr:putative methyltransferase C9orf114 [Ricinus communis]EEF45365.1 Protein C9orf114, putative [Ricinus communis]|eukprot:XP_002517202.1 putative methyltransferase C9orf114 [Ricinus communis]
MGKKKKRAEAEAQTETETVENHEPVNDVVVNGDSDRKKKKKKKEKERNERKKEENESKETATISIAVPGSIIDNAQSLELATRLAGQIARAATIFRIDEVVVFDNESSSVKEDRTTMITGNNSDENESGAAFLIRILRYLETPQYLRKALFPRLNSLRFVGLLPPLDAPHHLRKHEWAPFREGVTLKEKAPNSIGTLVDVGLSKNVVIDQVVEPGIRVTVEMGTDRNLDSELPRQVVSLSKPREEAGMYWGYRVRYASNISTVFNDCPYKGGYDHLVGTSEHGQIINASKLSLPTFRHLLIAFGGLAGLEESIEEDNSLKGKNVREVFNSYLNTCPHQGSRTIRTEEAIFISLQYFQEPINRALQRIQD